MKKCCSQGLLGKLGLSGIIIGLFTVVAFTPEVNSGIGPNSSDDNIYSTFTSQIAQPVFFTASVECINLTEPVSGNISKIPSSYANAIPHFYASDFQMISQYPGKYIFFSDKIPHKSFRQICLFLDIPPPVYC
jgi:hypothetical protein